jgi:OOP family OmpA-OmpF porin
MMRTQLAWVTVLFVGAAARPVTIAAAPEQRTGMQVTVSPFVGGAAWDAAVGRGDAVHYGGRIGVAINRWFGLEGTYGVSPHEGSTEDTRVSHTGADAVLSLPLAGRLTPYALGGWTQLDIQPDRGQERTPNGWEAGGGLRYGITETMAARLDVRDAMIEDDASGDWKHNILYTAGVHFAFGGQRRDTDGDGVADEDDGCADTPPGVVVDARGCPPVVARDADGDGVTDAADACPDTPRGTRVDARGCPADADADGIANSLDVCPDTPAGTRVDARGCPLDTDGDGVHDGLDRCPETAAGTRVDSTGCAIVARATETELLDTGTLRLEGVEFETGKATLRPESRAVLDEMGAVLADWPQVRVEFGGHTDSYGSEKANRDLSRRRARAVLDYIISKYPSVATTGHTVVGYGEGQPIADNATAEGRARNRRVQITILDREAFRREVERRQQKN